MQNNPGAKSVFDIDANPEAGPVYVMGEIFELPMIGSLANKYLN